MAILLLCGWTDGVGSATEDRDSGGGSTAILLLCGLTDGVGSATEDRDSGGGSTATVYIAAVSLNRWGWFSNWR